MLVYDISSLLLNIFANPPPRSVGTIEVTGVFKWGRLRFEGSSWAGCSWHLVGLTLCGVFFWRIPLRNRFRETKRNLLPFLRCSWHVFWFFRFLVLFIFTGGLQKTKFFATIPRVEMFIFLGGETHISLWHSKKRHSEKCHAHVPVFGCLARANNWPTLTCKTRCFLRDVGLEFFLVQAYIYWGLWGGVNTWPVFGTPVSFVCRLPGPRRGGEGPPSMCHP